MTHWITTGRATKYGEPLSWRLHAVKAPHDITFGEIRGWASACGLRATWGLDLFIDRKCAKCLRRLGLACLSCRGTGNNHDPLAKSSSCFKCMATGERRGKAQHVALAEKRGAD